MQTAEFRMQTLNTRSRQAVYSVCAVIAVCILHSAVCITAKE
jgi:hypothetical protein